MYILSHTVYTLYTNRVYSVCTSVYTFWQYGRNIVYVQNYGRARVRTRDRVALGFRVRIKVRVRVKVRFRVRVRVWG